MDAIADKKCSARARTVERAHGETITRELWTHSLKPGEVEFPGARFLLLVRQRRESDDGAVNEE